jgi:hypothetical protein
MRILDRKRQSTHKTDQCEGHQPSNSRGRPRCWGTSSFDWWGCSQDYSHSNPCSCDDGRDACEDDRGRGAEAAQRTSSKASCYDEGGKYCVGAGDDAGP